MQVTTKQGDLLNALANAALFASSDATLPLLSAVQLTASDGYLTATATDRYMVGQARVPLSSGTGNGEAMLIPVAELTPVIAALKREKLAYEVQISTPVELTAPSTVTVKFGPAAFTLNNIDGDFPKVAALYPDTVPDSLEWATHGVSVKNLTRLSKLRDYADKVSTPTVVFTGGALNKKPLSWTFSTFIKGLLMPVISDEFFESHRLMLKDRW